MKKIAILCLLFALLMPSQAFASSYGSFYYVSYLDQYRIDYAYNSLDARYELLFESSSGQKFIGSYDHKPSGIHYLTCNGEYRMAFYDSSGQVVHTLGPVTTTQILNPTCSSYADGVSGLDDLKAKATQVGDGRYRLDWSSVPDATNYKVYKDGQLIDSTPGNISETGKGSISIVAYDQNGNIVGRSDLTVPKANSDCCQWLSDLLACPDWDKYMGEVTKAIRNALPTLPEWRQIADQFVAAFADWAGPVPPPPTQQEIDDKLDTPLPPVDVSSEASNLVPTVPDGYETPKPFDISTGPQIQITDDSKPFQIFEPLHNIQYDDPGVPVIPGDPRNNTGGIQKPENLTLPTPNPTPSHSPELPNNPIPIPSIQPGPGPVPNGGSGPGPIPEWKGG